MYESPINIFERNICNKLTKEKENLVIAAVQEVGVTVDKAELEKALRYDRQQYEKGYADAKQAAIDALEKHEESQGHNYYMFRSVVSECAEIIRDLPPAQPERQKGKWEAVEGWGGDEPFIYRCSECGTEFVLIEGTPEENDYRFCPHCGARMDGEQNG